MANATWPTSLPDDPLQQGYRESRQSEIVRTEMDAGPPKMRRRFTASADRFQMRFRLTKSEVSTLETFFEDTLDGGSLPFNWTHPRTGNSAEFRFMEPYEISQLSHELFEVSARMEILP